MATLQDLVYADMKVSTNFGNNDLGTLGNLSQAIQGVFGGTYNTRGMITCTIATNPNESFDNCFVIDLHFTTETDGKAFPNENISTLTSSLGDLMQTNGYGGAYVEIDYTAGTARVYFNANPYGGYFQLQDTSGSAMTQAQVDATASTAYSQLQQAANTNGTIVVPSGSPSTGAPLTQTTPTTTTSTTPVTLNDPANGEALKTVNLSTADTNEFFRDCILLLEGVSVPYNTLTLSYGINTPPTCTLIIPAHSVIRELPEDTKVHIFFKDLLEDSDSQYKWRLLFDGEISSWSYSKDSKGAYITINCIHSCAYTTMMQVMTLDAAQYLFNSSTYIGGDSTIPIMFSQNRMHSTIIENILSKKYNSMVDIVYQMFRGILASNQDTGTGKFYGSKLGMAEGGWKLPGRFYGVSAATAAMDAPNVSWTQKVRDEGNTHKTTGTTTQGSSGSTGSNVSTATPTGCMDVGDSNAYLSQNSNLTAKQHAIGGSAQFQVPVSGSITSCYGPRDQPTDNASTWHKGIDIGADTGSEVYAAAGGVVSVPEYDTTGYGNYIIIAHSDGSQTYYGHLNDIVATDGSRVAAEQLIGHVGSTGTATGPHLHFGVVIGSTWGNPLSYL